MLILYINAEQEAVQNTDTGFTIVNREVKGQTVSSWKLRNILNYHEQR